MTVRSEKRALSLTPRGMTKRDEIGAVFALHENCRGRPQKH